MPLLQSRLPAPDFLFREPAPQTADSTLSGLGSVRFASVPSAPGPGYSRCSLWCDGSVLDSGSQYQSGSRSATSSRQQVRTDGAQPLEGMNGFFLWVVTLFSPWWHGCGLSFLELP